MQPYDHGYFAYENGFLRSENPYPFGSFNFYEWQDGWDDADEFYVDEFNLPVDDEDYWGDVEF